MEENLEKTFKRAGEKNYSFLGSLHSCLCRRRDFFENWRQMMKRIYRERMLVALGAMLASCVLYAVLWNQVSVDVSGNLFSGLGLAHSSLVMLIPLVILALGNFVFSKSFFLYFDLRPLKITVLPFVGVILAVQVFFTIFLIK